MSSQISQRQEALISSPVVSRRTLLGCLMALLATGVLPPRLSLAQTIGSSRSSAASSSVTVDAWMQDWMIRRGTGDPLKVQRFLDRVYFLIAPIQWRPEGSSSKFKEVVVPSGFVTDFASIPAVFWSILPPDGEYAYAAVIHDFLYWEQSLSRADADEILRLAMYDLDVASAKSKAIIAAVRIFGKSAWDRNASLKSSGEQRILRRYPTSAETRWEDFRKEPDVF
jgi:hypothetical protein